MRQRFKEWAETIKAARVVFGFLAVVVAILISISHAYFPRIARAYDIASNSEEQKRDSILTNMVRTNAVRLDTVKARQDRVLVRLDQMQLMMLLGSDALTHEDKSRIKAAILIGGTINFDSTLQIILLNQ